MIDEAAARAGRSISGEHFGMSIGYARVPIDPGTAQRDDARRPRSVDLTPVGLSALRERFGGASWPSGSPSSSCVRSPHRRPGTPLEALAGAVGDLQT